MTIRRSVLWLIPTATLLAFSTAGGCARVSSAIQAFKNPTTQPGAAPQPAPAPPPAAVAQAEDDAWANAPAEVPLVQPVAPPAPPLRVPVVNIFGELDGQQNKPRLEAGDAAYQQHTFADEGYDAEVTVDPTGRFIAFSSTRHSEKPDIYLQRVDGTSVVQLTSDPVEDSQPCFSPDGKTIAFASTRTGSWDLYTMDLDGKNVTQITNGPTQDMHPSFSPDGSRLVYSSVGGRSGQWELWVVDLTTREKKMVGYGLFPAWSPDKTVDRIAFQRARQRGSRWFSLWTLDLVGGEARRITEVAVSSNSAIVSPAWSPDGKRLAFATIVEPAQMNKGKPRGQQDVWVIDADGGNRHRLTDGNGTNLTPWWASDNRVYFVSDRGGHENVWSTRTDPVGPWPLASGGKTAPPAKAPVPQTEVGSTDVSDVAR